MLVRVDGRGSGAESSCKTKSFHLLAAFVPEILGFWAGASCKISRCQFAIPALFPLTALLALLLAACKVVTATAARYIPSFFVFSLRLSPCSLLLAFLLWTLFILDLVYLGAFVSLAVIYLHIFYLGL